MAPEYSKDRVYQAASDGFHAIYEIARNNAKRVWKDADITQRCMIARALVQINDIAGNPDKHLARKNTQDAWHDRACKEKARQGLNDISVAYCMVDGPVDIIKKSALPALVSGYPDQDVHTLLEQLFCKLANHYMAYDYNITSAEATSRSQARNCAENTIETSTKLQYHATRIPQINAIKKINAIFQNCCVRTK